MIARASISSRWWAPPAAYVRLSGNGRGALWLLVSALLFTAMTLLIKLLRGYAPPMQAFYTQSAGLLLLLPVIIRTRGKVFLLDGFWTQIGRSASAALGVTLSYYAVQHLPLADANALSFTRALWVAPLAALVLRDRVARSHWMALVAGFIGVLLVIRPSPHMIVGWAHLAALVSALLLALTVTGIKILTRKNSLATIMVWSALLGVAMVLPAAIGTWHWPTLPDFLLLLLLGGVSMLMTMSYIHGMAQGDAAKLISVDYVRLPLAILAGLIVFGEVPSGWMLAGSGLIVGTALWVALSDRRLPPPDTAALT